MADMSGLITGANLVGGLIRQGEQTQDHINDLLDERAKKRAGLAVASGDYSGAAMTLGGRGMIEPAAALNTQAATSNALTNIASGDFAAAKGAAAKVGDPALYGQVATQQQQEIKHRAEFMGNAADALAQIPLEQRKQAFVEKIAPVMKAMGVSDDDIAKVAGGDMSDQGIAAFKAAIGETSKLTIQHDPNTGDILGIDPATGAVKVLRKGAGKKQYEKLKNADGSETLLEIDPNADPNAATGAAPSGAPVSAATPAASGPAATKVGASATAHGAKPEEVAYLQRLVQVEDPKGDPNAKNGSSTGYFQFHPDTFAANGGGDIHNMDDQVKAALNLSKHDRATLTGLGVAPTDANTYIMHQQGPAGGPALFRADPNTSAVAALTPAYNGDVKKATQAVVNNGGSADMTAGEFIDYWHKRWAGGDAHSGQSAVKSALANTNLPPGVRILARSEGASETESSLSEASVALVGSDYLMRGADALRNLGQGKVGVENKNRILNWASKQAEDSGIKNPQVLARWVANKANTTALGKTQTTLSAVKQSEDTLLANMQLAERLAKAGGVGPSGVPLIDMPWNQARMRMGSADAKAYDNALVTTANEYAKILTTTGGTGNAPSSDSARAEAHRLFNSGQSLKQILASFAVAKQEAENRRTAIQAEHDFLVGEISGQKSAAAPGGAPAPAPKVRTYNPKTGRLE